MKEKSTLIFAGISMFISVVLGALGAHYLKETLEYPAKYIESWKTGVQYQQIHSIALILIVILQKLIPKTQQNKTIILFKLGIILFSGSIYILTINNSLHINIIPKIFGPITPIGGMLLIIGWLLFIISIIKTKK